MSTGHSLARYSVNGITGEWGKTMTMSEVFAFQIWMEMTRCITLGDMEKMSANKEKFMRPV